MINWILDNILWIVIPGFIVGAVFIVVKAIIYCRNNPVEKPPDDPGDSLNNVEEDW